MKELFRVRNALLLLLLLPTLLFGDDQNDEEEGEEEDEQEEQTYPLPIGNFSVPQATQIGPLVSFGQLIIGQDAFLPELTGTYIQETNGYDNVIAPSLLYGLRDDLSLFLLIPYTVDGRAGSSRSSGVNDIYVQLEYAPFTKNCPTYMMQTTIVGGVQFPTGSLLKSPPTGTGSSLYFLGATQCFLSFDWYAFVSAGVNLTTQHHNTRIGNSYLYQCGCARRIQKLSPCGWVFNLMVEFDGNYGEKNLIQGVTDPNSGGNIVYITPSLWLSSQRLLFQWGISLPLVQTLNGTQSQFKYAIDYNFGIAFQF